MVDPNPLLFSVGAPILCAPKVDTEATEGQGRAELGNVQSRVGWKLSGQNRCGVEGVRNQSWVSPQRPAEGAGSGLRWPELEQPGCDPGGGTETQPGRWKPISAQVAATAPDSGEPRLPRGCRDAGV